jgi:hypothetical protein
MQRTLLAIAMIGVLGCGGAPLPDPGPAPEPPPQLPDGTPVGADAIEPAPEPTAPAGAAIPECANRDDCNNMGVNAMLREDGAVAVALLQKACDMDNGVGCYNLAGVLLNDELVAKDQPRSAALFLRACELGEAKGCLGAGVVHYEGLGVGKDPAKALRLFEKSCDLGNAEACKNVGVLYWEGGDVGQDRDAAIRYFKKACGGGYQQSCDVVKEIEAQLAGGGAEAEVAGGVAGANLSVGSMSVNDMTVNDLECRLDSMGFMAAMQLVASIAAQKKAMDKCAPKGDAPKVKWTFSGGKAKQVEVEGAASIKIEKCVAIAAGKMASDMDGECAAYFLIGNAAGATAAYDKAKGGK